MQQKLKTKPKKIMTVCLLCGEDIHTGRNPKVGDLISCEICDAEFEIIALTPVVRIDWSEYDEYYDDDEDVYDDVDDEVNY